MPSILPEVRKSYGVLHPQIDTIDFFTDKKVVIARP